MDKRYEVKEVDKSFKVWDNKGKVWITKEVPTKEIADEICNDFNAMDNKDFRPIGLPNFKYKNN